MGQGPQGATCSTRQMASHVRVLLAQLGLPRNLHVPHGPHPLLCAQVWPRRVYMPHATHVQSQWLPTLCKARCTVGTSLYAGKRALQRSTGKGVVVWLTWVVLVETVPGQTYPNRPMPSHMHFPNVSLEPAP